MYAGEPANGNTLSPPSASPGRSIAARPGGDGTYRARDHAHWRAAREYIRLHDCRTHRARHHPPLIRARVHHLEMAGAGQGDQLDGVASGARGIRILATDRIRHTVVGGAVDERLGDAAG